MRVFNSFSLVTLAINFLCSSIPCGKKKHWISKLQLSSHHLNPVKHFQPVEDLSPGISFLRLRCRQLTRCRIQSIFLINWKEMLVSFLHKCQFDPIMCDSIYHLWDRVLFRMANCDEDEPPWKTPQLDQVLWLLSFFCLSPSISRCTCQPAISSDTELFWSLGRRGKTWAPAPICKESQLLPSPPRLSQQLRYQPPSFQHHCNVPPEVLKRQECF